MKQFFKNFQEFINGVLSAITAFMVLIMVLFLCWMVIILVIRIQDIILTRF